jgi:hypothetical protein
MQLLLEGPDDEGRWFLSDYDGNSWAVVERGEGLCFAASLFGWKPCEQCDADGTSGCSHTTLEEMETEAEAILFDHIGDAVTVPSHISDYFEDIQNRQSNFDVDEI